MVFEGDCDRTGAWHNRVTLPLVRPNAVPKECKELEVGIEETTRIIRGTNDCARWTVVIASERTAGDFLS